MPIILAPPSPLGSQASIGIGAGVAEQNAKMFPTLASLYEHIASLRAQGGGHGGGGGYGGGGGIQVLPRDDQGALYQVEAQANREQHSQNLAEQLGQPDYVMGHIRERENFQLRQQQGAQQSRQQELARLNPPAQPEPPPQWGQAEQNALTKATQAVAGLKDDVEKGQLGEETGKMVIAPYQDKIDALTQQQEAYQQYQQNKQFQAASQAQAQKRALVDTDIAHAAQSGYRQVPDLPTPIYDLDQHGKKYMVNEPVFKAAATQREKAIEYNHKVDLEAGKRKAEAEKADQAAEEHYLKHWGEAYKTVNKLEDEFMKGHGTVVDGKVQNRYRPNPKERADQVGEHLEALGLPKTLEEFNRRRKGLPAPVIPAEPGKASAVPMNTSKGQQEALDAILGKLAHTVPEPAPRRTLNPPGPMGAEAQAAQTNEQAGWGQWGPQF